MMGKTALNQQFEDPDPFPHTDSDEDEIEVEVLDDTPPEDIREARPAADRVDVDSDEFEQEIQHYSDNAQKRIKAVKFEYHEERRAKESAQRRAEEATRYAEQANADNSALKQSLENSNTVLIEQYGARTDAELDKARSEFKEAYEGGDTDKLLEAQERLATLHAERVGTAMRQHRPASAPQQAAPQQAAPQQQAGRSPPDARGTQWMRLNTWYQAKGNEDMTGYAVGLHQKLIEAGYDPRVDEAYYTKIDEGVRAVFPDRFSDGDLGGNGGSPPAATPRGRKPPVGGPTRGGKPPRKVQLTATQVALAKRLGLSNKQYAVQLAKEQLTDG
tara:strand:- start:3920 stop:4912 length:993 start_codon:yes stop_codon:yes gene_type:complete